MKTLLSIVVAVSLMNSVTEKKNELALKKEVKEVSLTSGKIPNTKISFTVSTVRRGMYTKIEFTNDYYFPVLLEGIIDGVLIDGKKDYKIRIKPNSRKSILIRQIRRKIYPIEECNNFSPYDACADTKREILFNYNRFDTSLIHVFNHKLEIIEDKNKKQLEGKVRRTILR